MNMGIMCHDSLGGSARVATELARHLAQRGHHIHLFARSTPFGVCNSGSKSLTLHRIVPNGQRGHHPAKLYTTWRTTEIEAMLAQVSDLIEQQRLDILHFHYAVPFAFFAKALKKRFGRYTPKIVGTLHGTDVSIHGQEPEMGARLRQALKYTDCLTTVSNSYAGLATDVFQLSIPPRVIPNFVDLLTFQPRPTIHKGLPTGFKPKIAYVSNFRAVKDPQSMARIFIKIRRHLEAELWLIGEGPEMSATRMILEAAGVGNDVHYWGLQTNVAPILAQTDLLMITSRAESFSLAAVEAMACGVPVIASNVGGLPEVMAQGQTGYLFPVNDHEVAVQQALALLSSPNEYQKMRLAAVKQAHRFQVDKIIPMYEALYQETACKVVN